MAIGLLSLCMPYFFLTGDDKKRAEVPAGLVHYFANRNNASSFLDVTRKF